MTARLQHLVHVRSKAAEEMLVYLDSLRQQMSQNKLLERFGRKLDDLRVPLRVVPFEPVRDFDTVRARENLRLEGLGDDDDDEKTTRRIYGGREQLWDEEEKTARPRPEPLAQLEPRLDRAVLLGDPGSGKTEWLKHLARRAAQTAYDHVHDFALPLEDIGVPALLRLSDIAAQLRATNALKARLLQVGAIASLHEVPDDAECVAAAMLNALVAHHHLSERLTPLVWQQWFAHPASRIPHPSLLCLDAWDEARASDEEKQRLANCLTAFSHKAHARIFLTSRIIGYSHQPLPVERKAEGTRRELEILPFEWNETEQFVQSFFGESDDGKQRGQQMLKDLRSKIAVAGMAQNPLLSTLLCMAFSPSPHAQPLAFPARRVEVYERVLEGLLGEWEALDKGVKPPKGLIPAKLRLLEEMAYHFYPDEALSSERLYDFLYDEERGYLTRLNQAHPLMQITAPTMLEELGRDGILVPHGGAGAEDFLFLHLTFQEYLSACALARRAQPKNGGWERIKDFVDAKAWAPEWEEVIILMAGKLDDPVLLFALLDNAEEDDLFRSRLCLLARCLPELPITGHRNSPGTLTMRQTELNALADKTAQAVFHLWWEQQAQGYEFFALRRGLRAIAQSEQETVIATILHHLHDVDRNVRRYAVRALGTMAAAAATVPVLTTLLRALFDANMGVCSTLQSMGVAAATEPVVTALLRALHNDSMRSIAVKALGAMGATAATGPVLTTLLKDLQAGAFLRSIAVEALTAMGVALPIETVLPALLQDLHHEYAPVRSNAVRALGAMGIAAATESVLTTLLQDLHNADENVHSNAVRALGAMGAAAATEPVLTILLQDLHNVNRDVRWNGVRALEAMGYAAATEPVLTALLRTLHDTDGHVCWGAVKALGAMGAAAATEPVLTTLLQDLHDTDAYVRSIAVRALGAIGAAAATESVLTALLQALCDANHNVRWNVISALEAMGVTAATEPMLTALLRTLNDADEYVRSSAVRALGAMGIAAATEPVLTKLLQDLHNVNRNVRRDAAEALGKLMRRGMRIYATQAQPSLLPQWKAQSVRELSRWERSKP